MGTTLLITPDEQATDQQTKSNGNKKDQHVTRRNSAPVKQRQQHYIACLFTSHGYGRSVDKPTDILQATESALADLERQIKDLELSLTLPDQEPETSQAGATTKNVTLATVELEAEVATQEEEASSTAAHTNPRCRAVRINSGRFGVPWPDTKKVLEASGLDVLVVSPPADSDGGHSTLSAKRKRDGGADAGSGTKEPRRKGGIESWLKSR